MAIDLTRLIRDRLALDRPPQALARVADRAQASTRAPRGSPRLLGLVVNKGAMPGSTEKVFLINPVRLEGGESEGAAAAPVVDCTRTILVVVIGSTLPVTGDLILAHAVGGRWVAEKGASASSLSCSPCPIPKKNLTVSWTNPKTSVIKKSTDAQA
jgi:hypothetical protein